MQHREMVQEWIQTFWLIPFYNVEARNPVLPSYGVQVAAKNSHSHTCATGTGGGNITAPLIGFRVISETGKMRSEEIFLA